MYIHVNEKNSIGKLNSILDMKKRITGLIIENIKAKKY